MLLYFARVREEMARGKSVKNALKAGFQKAMSAIIDGNVTTLIAAAVLWFMGSGTVKGFAQTLAIGIVVSMFTALVITRIDCLLRSMLWDFGAKSFIIHPKKERQPIDFLGKKKYFFTLSIAVMLIGLGVHGL